MPALTDFAGLYALATAGGSQAAAQAASIIANQERYESVAIVANAPWWWVGCVHWMEASGSFRCHLHNGDPLNARTVQVPAGRPLGGDPPFTWEDSATDALSMRNFTPDTDWSIDGALNQAERYNGEGYHNRGIRSPYLWWGTSLQQTGRFTSDHGFDPNARSNEPGVAAMMKALEAAGLTLE
jgi:lysozyme family protein